MSQTDCQCCIWRLAVRLVEGYNACETCAHMLEDSVRFLDRLVRETGTPIDKAAYLIVLVEKVSKSEPKPRERNDTGGIARVSKSCPQSG